jgi:hypothetical protein
VFECLFLANLWVLGKFTLGSDALTEDGVHPNKKQFAWTMISLLTCLSFIYLMEPMINFSAQKIGVDSKGLLLDAIYRKFLKVSFKNRFNKLEVSKVVEIVS